MHQFSLHKSNSHGCFYMSCLEFFFVQTCCNFIFYQFLWSSVFSYFLFYRLLGIFGRIAEVCFPARITITILERAEPNPRKVYGKLIRHQMHVWVSWFPIYGQRQIQHNTMNIRKLSRKRYHTLPSLVHIRACCSLQQAFALLGWLAALAVFGTQMKTFLDP